MVAKRKVFKDVIFELLKHDSNFDKMEYQLLKAFDLFSKNVPSFKKMSSSNQYFICETGLLLSLGASSEIIRKSRILTKPKPSETEIKYSPSYGFKESKILELGNQKLLENGKI